MKRGVLVATYDLNWPAIFEAARAEIKAAIGASVAEVQAQLGHASATTTMNFYVSPNEDRQAAMVDRFGAMLDEVGEHKVDDLLTDRSRARREGAA